MVKLFFGGNIRNKRNLVEPLNIEDANSLPVEVRAEIKNGLKIGKMDTARKIALIEMGLLRRMTEEDIAEEMNWTWGQFVLWKKNNRPKIESFKDDIRSSKYNLMESINNRMGIANAYSHAVLSGDAALAKKTKTVLVELEKILPIRSLQNIGEILEKMDDVPKDDPQGRANIQINVNSPASEAKKRLQEIKEKKELPPQVDV